MQKFFQEQRIEKQSYTSSAHYTLMVLHLASPQEQGLKRFTIIRNLYFFIFLFQLALISWKDIYWLTHTSEAQGNYFRSSGEGAVSD